ncbi:MAG: Gfo/Idh/MocA family protein [Candidatus Helarchaeota archaeon]
MNENDVRIGLIGIGQIGKTHVISAQNLSNTCFIAVYHPNSDRGFQFAKEYNIKKSFSDLKSFFSDSEIKAVDICTPTHTHFDFIKKCLENDKHVLVEKPITRTLEEFDLMMDLLKKHNQRLMVAQYCRFIPEYQTAKKILSEKKIGTPICVRAYRRVKAPTYKDWFFDEKKSGGIILDLMIHDIDAVLWVLDDKVEYIHAITHNFNLPYKTPDHATVILKFKKGTIATISGSWILPDNFFTPSQLDTTLEIFGDSGAIEICDRNDSFMRVFTPDEGLKLTKPDPLRVYRSEISHFSDCILKNKPFKVDLNSVRNSLEICLLALESYKTKSSIHL